MGCEGQSHPTPQPNTAICCPAHFWPQKPATAWGYVTAHMTRIHDIDWSYDDEHQLTTCSHDSSVKFWDTSSPREPLSVIKTGSQPVWRARNYVGSQCVKFMHNHEYTLSSISPSLFLPPSLPHSSSPSLSPSFSCFLPPQPVGHGVAMLLVPALHSLENRVFLWSRSNVFSPVSTLQGHKGAVVEAQWRKVQSGTLYAVTMFVQMTESISYPSLSLGHYTHL